LEYKDYYETLGVSRGAGKDEIQKAYRKLARKYHPDVSKVEDAETRFKEINEAYEVLKDPEKRKKYDQFGSAWKQARQSGSPPPGWEGIPFDFSQFTGQAGAGGPGGGFHFEGGGPGFGGSGFSDFFEMLFGGAGGGAGAGFGGRRGRHQAARKGADQETTITLTLEEAARGGKREIALTDGSGQTKTLSVKIPPGVKPGGKIRLSGQGAAGAGGGPAGDLYLRVDLVPHPTLRLQGTDLHTTVPIAPWEAALGGQATVPTLNGTETIKIPAGTSSGRRVRLRGKGFPRKKDGSGDLYAEFRIVVPDEPSDEERALYEQLKEASDFEPRA
jgi:curved DNA-binding protein